MVAAVTAAVAALSSIVSATLPPRYCSASNSTCWPTAAEWDTLNASVAGRLFVVQRPAAVSGPAGAFLRAAEPGAMQYSNWQKLSLPALGVRAAAPDDVVAVMQFVNRTRVRLVIKATGHDYNGRSTAEGALLLWMHEMRSPPLFDDAMSVCGSS